MPSPRTFYRNRFEVYVYSEYPLSDMTFAEMMHQIEDGDAKVGSEADLIGTDRLTGAMLAKELTTQDQLDFFGIDEHGNDDQSAIPMIERICAFVQDVANSGTNRKYPAGVCVLQSYAEELQHATEFVFHRHKFVIMYMDKDFMGKEEMIAFDDAPFLEEQQWFIPSQVGLEDLQHLFGNITSDDHC